MLHGKAYVCGTKNFCALLKFTEKFSPLLYSIGQADGEKHEDKFCTAEYFHNALS